MPFSQLAVEYIVSTPSPLQPSLIKNKKIEKCFCIPIQKEKMSLVEMVEMSTSTKTCTQYDDWKEEQRINNPNTFISDKEYLEERKDYFAKWLQRLQERYDEQEYDTYKLPPYTLQELEQFQKLNKIYLPIHLVFYLTQF